MMIEQFIDRLQQQGLLDKEVIDDLRRKVARVKGQKITPEAIAKYLVDKGHLTRFQATKLVSDVTHLLDAGALPGKPTKQPDLDGLTLLPDDDDLTATRETQAMSESVVKRPTRSPDEELDELTAIDDRPEEQKRAEERKASAQRAAAERHAAEERATEKTAEQQLAAERRQAAQQRVAAKKAADEKLKAAERKAAQEKKAADDREAAETRRLAAQEKVAAVPVPPVVSEPPIPSPPRPARPEQLDDLDADIEAGSKLVSDGRSPRGLTGLFGGGAPQSPAQRRLQKSSEWDSTLLLVGGASLGVLLVLGAFLYLSLTRGAAEELFAAAETAYAEESYSLSIKLYNKFLDAHSKHEKASKARVKREAAQLRQVFKDPERGLKVAQEELPKIKQEEAFPQIRDELASMLPQIARGFVDQAMLADDPAVQQSLLEKTEQAMVLVNDPEYIPSMLRKSQQTTIAAIEDDVQRVTREIDRERTLTETIDAITSAVTAGDTQLAYDARYALLSRYPGLDTDEKLHEAVLAISEKEREKVHAVDEPLRAVNVDAAASKHKSVILANRMGQPVSSLSDRVVFVLAGGCVFALDAATGDVLWRRFVGMETTTYPIPVSNAADADAIVVDRRTQEIMRLDARTGKLAWRIEVGEPFATPVLLEDRLYVSGQSGRLIPVDIDTGNTPRHVQIPQPLEVGPGVAVPRPYLYQAGDQDNLYVISPDTLECKEVFYIGHKRGTITVPPVMVLGFLFVVENAGPDFCYLHIIGCDAQGLNLKTAQKKIRLQGQVIVPLLEGRRRLLVVTDRRAVELYEVEPNSDGLPPVTTVGRHNATNEDPIISYPLYTPSGYIWVANNRFTKYQVQAAKGKLPSEWVQDVQDVYVGPLQLVRDTIIHIRRRQGALGYTVAATSMNAKDPSWQTELAVPIRNIAINGEAIESVTARGRLFEVTAESMDNRVVAQAKASAMRDERITLALSQAAKVDEETWVLAPRSGYNQVIFHRLTGDRAGLKALTLTVPLGDASIEPTPFGGGLLVPLRDGRIMFSDPITGGERAGAFHPAIEAGMEIRWYPAAVIDGGKEFVIANNQQRIYRVGVSEKPQPHLQELGSVTTTDRIFGPLATVGQVFYGTTRSATADTLLCFALPETKEVQKIPLAERVRWGPQRVGDIVLVATDAELLCMDAQQQKRWGVPWRFGPVAGQPLIVEQQLLLAAENGMVLAMDAATGSTIAATDVGEPVNGGPVVFQDQLLVAGTSGVLFVVAHPSP